MIAKGSLTTIPVDSIIGFDAEWTKNYKMKNGNIPFCFSLVVMNREELNISKLSNGNIRFDYIQYYSENREDFKQLVAIADSWLSKVLEVLDSCVLCGHQISSDFAVLYNIGKAYAVEPLIGLKQVWCEWKRRKELFPVRIVDTRYDIVQDFLGKSRRLVDMCNDFYLDVTQPELRKSSMTKLQNIYYQTNDDRIRERISVMNLRHSLCAMILFWMNEKNSNDEQRKHIDINKSIYTVLKGDFHWVNTEEFYNLLRR